MELELGSLSSNVSNNEPHFLTATRTERHELCAMLCVAAHASRTADKWYDAFRRRPSVMYTNIAQQLAAQFKTHGGENPLPLREDARRILLAAADLCCRTQQVELHPFYEHAASVLSFQSTNLAEQTPFADMSHATKINGAEPAAIDSAELAVPLPLSLQTMTTQDPE